MVAIDVYARIIRFSPSLYFSHISTSRARDFVFFSTKRTGIKTYCTYMAQFNKGDLGETRPVDDLNACNTQSTNVNLHNACNTLMLSYVFRSLPTARHHTWACSAGSKGYCATKEMLQNGIPGHTLLIESNDLRDVNSGSSEGDECCLVYGLSVLSRNFRHYTKHIPATTKHVAVYCNCEYLPPELLKRTAITSVDLSPLLTHVTTEIKENCLAGCTELKTVDLSALSHVKKVQGGLLMGCTGLSAIDLSPLSNITVVHSDFLCGCSGIAILDLSPLTRVKEVHGLFLHKCVGLKCIDLSPLSQVTVVHDYFLSNCSGLTTLDLSPLSNLTVIRNFFLSGCSGLKQLDLGAFSQVTEVQGLFLSRCSGLTTLDLTPLSNVSKVFDGFLFECTGLSAIDLSPLSNITVVQEAFLSRCTGLTSLDMSPLSNVDEVQDEFLEGCCIAVDNPPPQSLPPPGWYFRRNTSTGTEQWVPI